MAAGALTSQQLPAIAHMRAVNLHVASALADWRRTVVAPDGSAGAAVPRQTIPGPASGAYGALSGSSSFGMSGVNAHALLSAPNALTPKVRFGLQMVGA